MKKGRAQYSGSTVTIHFGRFRLAFKICTTLHCHYAVCFFNLASSDAIVMVCSRSSGRIKMTPSAPFKNNKTNTIIQRLLILIGSSCFIYYLLVKQSSIVSLGIWRTKRTACCWPSRTSGGSVESRIVLGVRQSCVHNRRSGQSRWRSLLYGVQYGPPVVLDTTSSEGFRDQTRFGIPVWPMTWAVCIIYVIEPAIISIT